MANRVVGRGKIYFRQFADNDARTGGDLMYLGNTPSFSLNVSETTLDHFNSESGLKEKDASVTLTKDVKGKFETDEISAENMALWFSGETSTITPTADVADVEQDIVVKLGKYYAIGVTASNPVGVRHVTTTSMADDADASIASSGNWSFDAETGMLYILPTASSIADGDTITFKYRKATGPRTRVNSAGASIYGELRFVADNPVGENKDVILPCIKLTSDGDLEFKSDQWQKMSFAIEALKKDDTTEIVYIENRS